MLALLLENSTKTTGEKPRLGGSFPTLPLPAKRSRKIWRKQVPEYVEEGLKNKAEVGLASFS